MAQGLDRVAHKVLGKESALGTTHHLWYPGLGVGSDSEMTMLLLLPSLFTASGLGMIMLPQHLAQITALASEMILNSITSKELVLLMNITDQGNRTVRKKMENTMLHRLVDGWDCWREMIFHICLKNKLAAKKHLL